MLIDQNGTSLSDSNNHGRPSDGEGKAGRRPLEDSRTALHSGGKEGPRKLGEGRETNLAWAKDWS